jgi:molybdopterin molybdotransferase
MKPALSLRRNVQPLDAVRAPLAQARGRVLREDIVAPEDLPGVRSLSGWMATRLRSTIARSGFGLSRRFSQGRLATRASVPGECARIFTGAAIPAGASQFIMQEDTQRDGDTMIPGASDQGDAHPHAR